jgi:hypothetical protein
MMTMKGLMRGFGLAMALAALSGVAGAQTPRFQATRLTEKGGFGGLNNNGQLIYTQSFGHPNFGTWLREPSGSQRFCYSGPLNDNGLVSVGMADSSTRAQIWDSNTNTVRTLGLVNGLGGYDFARFSISNSGRVTAAANFMAFDYQSATWAPDGTGSIVQYQGRGLQSLYLNNRDDMAGFVYTLGKSVIFRNGGPTQLVDVGGIGNEVIDLADNGDALTFKYITSVSNSVSLILDTSLNIKHQLSNASGYARTWFLHMNSANAVVGAASNADYPEAVARRATFWTPNTGTLFLDAITDGLPSGLQLTGAEAINERGEIIATRTYLINGGPSTGQEVYLLRPVPEPATMAGLGVGVLALLRKRRKPRK